MESESSPFLFTFYSFTSMLERGFFFVLIWIHNNRIDVSKARISDFCDASKIHIICTYNLMKNGKANHYQESKMIRPWELMLPFLTLFNQILKTWNTRRQILEKEFHFGKNVYSKFFVSIIHLKTFFLFAYFL